MAETLRVLRMNYRSDFDRVGAHCLHYICIIVLAHFKDMPILIEKDREYLYVDDIFMSSLYDYYDIHNRKYIDKLKNASNIEKVSIYDLLEIEYHTNNCNLTYVYKIVNTIKSDIYSYYKLHIMDEVLNIFDKKLKDVTSLRKFIKPSEDTLVLHLRLDDCQDITYDYKGDDFVLFFNDYIGNSENVSNLTSRFKKYSQENQTEIYQNYRYINKINQIMRYVRNNIIDIGDDNIKEYLKNKIGVDWRQVLIFNEEDDILLKDFILKYRHMELKTGVVVNYSRTADFIMPLQSIIDESRLEKLIKEINNHDNYNIEIVACMKDSIVNLPYKVISNSAEEDLYYLSNSKNLIFSRSTFSLTSLFFNKNIVNVWIPNWGISLSLGFNTKYDKTKFNYF